MFRRKKTTDPTPPTNIRIITREGEEIPVDSVYQGTDDDGIHVWDVVNRRGDIKGMTMDVLPPNTAVGFHVDVPWDEEDE